MWQPKMIPEIAEWMSPGGRGCKITPGWEALLHMQMWSTCVAWKNAWNRLRASSNSAPQTEATSQTLQPWSHLPHCSEEAELPSPGREGLWTFFKYLCAYEDIEGRTVGRMYLTGADPEAGDTDLETDSHTWEPNKCEPPGLPHSDWALLAQSRDLFQIPVLPPRSSVTLGHLLMWVPLFPLPQNAGYGSVYAMVILWVPKSTAWHT